MRKKDDDKQNRIKKAVVQIILEQGFHGTSISKIAKAANVSPATVYIYYKNKEEMLKDIYSEYVENFYQHLTSNLNNTLSGEEFINLLIRDYYQYIIDNEEIFHFIDQFNACPSLSQGCQRLQKNNLLNEILLSYKSKDIIYDYYDENIWAMLFYPVKSIAKKADHDSPKTSSQLDELIMIIQKSLLK